MKKYKIVVYVPEDHADQLREAMGNAGAGEIGNYTNCTTVKGTDRFKPGEGANPTIGVWVSSKKLPKTASKQFGNRS